jgi:hypothetical protein
MHTRGLLGKHVSMTFPTFHRIEPAPVPAFRADMAIETFRRAVWGALKKRHIDFVAIVAGVLFLSVDRLHHKQQAAD